MTTYHSHGVKLSSGQKEKLARAFRNNSAITIRLSKNELTGPDQLMLTKTHCQINRLKKACKTKLDQISKSAKHKYGKLYNKEEIYGLPFSISGQNCFKWQQNQLDH